ncbi:MAG: aldo/keto reductase [Myxococcaceae bacterium]|nr:aldo/keto reductase [Myxococcaceae bacterium]
MTTRRLGRTDAELSSIGLGCWQFSEGFGLVGGFWPALPQPLVDEIVAKSLAGGITWFDTAEAYGDGRSEQALARALDAAGKKPGEVFVATKWMPAARTAASATRTIDTRLAKLAPWPIDLHQVHQPFGLSSVEAEMSAFADLVAAKKIRFVGVSNFNEAKMRRAQVALQQRGLALASNQVKYSLLDRRIEKNGVLAAAKELGVTVIAYSPLEQGLLSGKFHHDPSLVAGSGFRKWTPRFRASGLAKSRPLIDELAKIAQAHGATSSQVALSWLVQFHGDTVVAIPGATKTKHVEENVGAMRLTLSKPELERLDELSRPLS